MDEEPTKEKRPVTCGIIDSIFDCCSVQPMIVLFYILLIYVYILYCRYLFILLSILSIYYELLLMAVSNSISIFAMVSLKK